MESRKSLPLVGLVAVLALALWLSSRVQSATAQPNRGAQQTAAAKASGPGGCIADVCSKASPCTAGDTSVTSITTLGVVEPCTSIGDTGTYYFQAVFQSGATTRYDPTVWIAMDGGNAKNGVCYSDYLTPTLKTTNTPPFPPYWDAEQNGDQCGDISSSYSVTKVVGPVTITCTASNMGGTIGACSAYDNNASNNCPANNGCPDVGSKCKCQSVPFEVTLNQVDLALVKTASVTQIPSSGQFDYLFTVSNVQYTTPCYTSTGYLITDNLPIWLKVRSLPAGCTSTPDTAEACYGYVGGCQGYGDIVKCTVTTDLACGATAPTITLPVVIWQGDPTVPDTDPRHQLPPASLANTACVAGFEVDPVQTNNCGSVSVPTAVELVSFTATSAKKAIILNWETASEVDNLGFNMYRAENVGGPVTKINAELILSVVPPGSPFGAVYEYLDTAVYRRTTYYYWLEDVDIYGKTGLHGPVEANLSGDWLKELPVKGRPSGPTEG